MNDVWCRRVGRSSIVRLDQFIVFFLEFNMMEVNDLDFHNSIGINFLS